DGKQRITANMRLFLAVAVLMLALVAYTEAQDTDTLEQRFNQFRERMTEVGKNLAEGAKDAFDKVHNSEFAVNTRNTLADFWEKLRIKATEAAQ
ncbi:hypothetical protein O3J80_21195, partial [Yersinia pestis]|nr:hypothetical protein [Yersinia pestis]